MKRCSFAAFVRCPPDERCGDYREACFMEGSECDAFNQEVSKQVKICGDYIRSIDLSGTADWTAYPLQPPDGKH